MVKEKEEALAALKTSLLQSSQTSLKDNDEEVSRKVQAEVRQTTVCHILHLKLVKFDWLNMVTSPFTSHSSILKINK